MTYNVPEIAWAPLAPIIIVLVAGAIGVLLGAFIRTVAVRRTAQLQLSIVALIAALFAIVWQWVAIESGGVVVLNTMIYLDRQALAWQFLLVVFAIGGVALFADRGKEDEDPFTPLGSVAPGSSEETVARRKGLAVTEVFPLALLATGGMMLFATVNDLVFLFVALELFSLPLYILVALARRRRLLSQEASLKYFLLGAFSSAIFLFGVALLYGATETTGMREMLGLYHPERHTLVLLGLFMVLVGLLFKIGAVPFHLWVPDAYQGAPSAVTAFMAAATKAAAVAALARLSYLVLYRFAWDLNWVIWTVAIASMVFGTVLAIVQTDVKRMLAYSSVAHAGFILVAFAGFSPLALSALPFYLATYGIATLGAFAVVTQVRELTPDGAVGAEATRLGQWAGLGKRSPLLAVAMSLFLLSFAGIPLTAGFVGKFVVFRAALEQGAWPLVVVAVLASAAAVFFYIRLAVLMFFTDAPDDTSPRVEVRATGIGRGVAIVAAVIVLVLGVMPSGALDLADDAGVLLAPAAVTGG
ncbi:NADH-quinone oxidoreductase subunit NuoN [Demequina sp. TTPB684]|uniref:NADH-quinone oxidoreductase subunit NuoN n=1 Tax=unclassified Demequina TaxID=2620311 RepID=UPI001CF3534D|nr:NADH-quinone oxidoreductase subunit NuoN [Demequina sp. TTPB684]